MPTGGLIAASVAAPIISSVIGNAAASGDDDKAKAARAEALRRILGVQVPTVEEQEIALEKYGVAGQLNPEMEAIVTQDPSAMEGISTDPKLRQAQMRALAQLGELGTTGLTASDREALANINNQISGDATSAGKAITANLNARGMGGGGAELAARMMAAQGAANRGAAEGRSVASQAQAKALQAMSNAGALGSQMEGQQFGEDAQKASAVDAINRFNAANRQNVYHGNTGARNSAQEFNVRNTQDVANRNTDVANKQETYNKGLKQTRFANEMTSANAAADQYGQESKASAADADRTRKMAGEIGQGIGSGFAAGGAYMGRTKAPKTGVDVSALGDKPNDVSEEDTKKAFDYFGGA